MGMFVQPGRFHNYTLPVVGEVAAKDLAFVYDKSIDVFSGRIANLDRLNEPFDSDTGQFSLSTDATLGTFTVASGIGTVVQVGEQATFVRTGPDVTMPQVFVQADVNKVSGAPSGYDSMSVGIGKDNNNFIIANVDKLNSIIRVIAKISGTYHFLDVHSYTVPSSFTLALSIVGNSACAWTNEGSGWVCRSKADISSYIDFQTAVYTGWKSFIGVAAGNSTSWSFDNLILSYFSGVGMRDFALVTHEDGTPVLFGSKYRLTATVADPNAWGYWGVIEWDPATETVQIVGIIMTQRSGRIVGDVAGHIVKNDDSSWRLVISTWGNPSLSDGLAVMHKTGLVTDPTTGASVITGLTKLTLPLIPGGSSGGSYDAMIIKHGGLWYITYAVVDNISFAGENFYVALASSTDMITFTGIGADSSRTVVEGPKFIKVNTVPYIIGGGRGRQPVYDLTMTYLGNPTFDVGLYTGTDTQPHVSTAPISVDRVAFTWDDTKFGGQSFTWGRLLIYKAPRYT
jgi:hypothetical protein